VDLVVVVPDDGRRLGVDLAAHVLPARAPLAVLVLATVHGVVVADDVHLDDVEVDDHVGRLALLDLAAEADPVTPALALLVRLVPALSVRARHEEVDAPIVPRPRRRLRVQRAAQRLPAAPRRVLVLAVPRLPVVALAEDARVPAAP